MTQLEQSIERRIARGVGHPMRMRILTVLFQRVASPKMLASELGESLGSVAYHVRILAELDLIELVDTAPRRGATEHFYKARAEARLDAEQWSEVPHETRGSIVFAVLQQIAVDVAIAAEAEGFNDEHAHLSRMPLLVDKQGFVEINAILDGALAEAQSVAQASVERLSTAAKPMPVPAGMVLMLFEGMQPRPRNGP